ncbi:hypothetical protein [Streptomyces griseocarneus]|uniref:hypothetical protein n=1 Tax=Streptomyces griseocarneus TaxID=51201 RepID=UPI00167C9E23|nr:hypothetical protein [Streptomyces griseocarneus]MBZ6476657.1 hypothetical protein [Streptomyces griseocarneus]GHG80164.1 hypothetical protein GCM10018779_61500 [Streptomyces griseocarneus]
MAEGLQAGRLDVPVVADLAGFARELRTKVEAAAEGLAVKVKVKVDSKGLRKKLESAVKEASKGVSAKVKIKVDDQRLRAELDNIARRIASTDVRVPVRPDGDSDGNGRGGGLLSGIRNLIRGAQGEADRTPVNVPVRMQMPRGRRSMRMLGIGSLLALAQPAVAALTQYGAGLTALVSAAAPAVGVLGAIPGLIVATGTAAIGTKVAFSGFGEALKQTLKAQQQAASGAQQTKAQQEALTQSLDGLSASARKTVTTVGSLSGAWRKMRQSVQERFFSQVANEIKPLSSAVLPLLKDSLGDTAGQMGNLAKRGAQFMQSGPFRRDFKKIAATNSTAIGHMTDGLANLGHASLDFLVASGPFVERVSGGVERFTQWTRASVQAGRETGSLAKFLDHAGDKASQLGRSTWDLVKGLGGVGKAAQDSGNALLDGFEGTMIRFKRWANSAKGQTSMKQFFSDAGPTFHELNRLVGDFFLGLGRAAKDNGVTDLIRQIRTQLMPALGTFFDSIGHSIGPALISLVSNLAIAIGNLSAAGTGLGVLLAAFNGLLHVFNSLMGAIPGANTALAALLGTMLALKVISGVTSMLRGFGTSIMAAGQSMNATVGVLRNGTAVAGQQVSVWNQMRTAYRGAAADGGRLSGTLRGIGAANRVASSAVGGMVSALGGPLGIAIAGVTIGLGLLAAKQEAAARAAAAHEERINSLAQALADSNGQIDANVRAQAAQYLQDVKLSSGKGKLVDVLRSADVSLKQVTDAYLDQGGSIEGLEKKLRGLAKETEHYVSMGPKADVLKMTPQGEKYKAAADALKDMSGELDKSKSKAKELNEAVNGSASTGTSAYSRLQAAVQGFSDKTKSADERVDALRRALNALNGNQQSFHDATAQLNSVMLQIDDTMKGNIDKAEGWGQALVDNDGLVNTATRNGQSLNSQLSELRDAMLGVATRAQEASEQGLMPMSEAMNKGQEAMERARAKAIQLAMDMGIPEQQAKALADQMGFIPETVTTLMTTQGIPQATAEVLGLRGQLEGLGSGKSITVSAPTAEARAQLQALGFQVQVLPGGKQVTITAPTDGARLSIAALAQDIANAPNRKDVTVNAIVQQATGDLTSIRNQVAGLPPGKTLKMEAPTATAQQAIRDLGYKVKELKGKQIEITAPNSTPIQQVQAIQNKINSLTGKTVTVTVEYTTSGKPYVSEHADGGILRFANGGIRRAGSRIQAFASGSERHVAQIARPGEWRLWAEPETGGEAYIPLSSAKRTRSKQIVEEVVRQFGGVVAWANGALRQYAGGAVAVNRGTRSAAPRASVPQAATPALIGGDLNLTMTGRPMNPGEALNDAMFELRRIRMGGAHVAG